MEIAQRGGGTFRSGSLCSNEHSPNAILIFTACTSAGRCSSAVPGGSRLKQRKNSAVRDDGSYNAIVLNSHLLGESSRSTLPHAGPD